MGQKASTDQVPLRNADDTRQVHHQNHYSGSPEAHGPGMSSDGVAATQPFTDSGKHLSTEGRAILWEVNIARGCVESFSKILDAHAIVLSLLVTVNLIGFLQPPRGLEQGQGVMFESLSLRAFSVANSLSLFMAIAGLLFYLYCSYATIVSLVAVPLPDRFDERGLAMLYTLRAALRCVALPSVRRRSNVLFSALVFSLFFCVAAYISAGFACTHPEDRFVSVVLPAIPGCLLIMYLLLVSASKLNKELNFDGRFDKLWTKIVGLPQPAIRPLGKETQEAIDPIPKFLSWFAGSREDHTACLHKHESRSLLQASNLWSTTPLQI